MKIIKTKKNKNGNPIPINEEYKMTENDILELDKKYFKLKNIKTNNNESKFICDFCDLSKKYKNCLVGCTKIIEIGYALEEIEYYELLFGEKINKGCD